MGPLEAVAERHAAGDLGFAQAARARHIVRWADTAQDDRAVLGVTNIEILGVVSRVRAESELAKAMGTRDALLVRHIIEINALQFVGFRQV